MSLYDQIKEEHLFYAKTGTLYRGSQCVCDGAFYNWEHREREHEAHVIAEFEKALRTQIAADIRAQAGGEDQFDAGSDMRDIGTWEGMLDAADLIDQTNRHTEEGTTK